MKHEMPQKNSEHNRDSSVELREIAEKQKEILKSSFETAETNVRDENETSLAAEAVNGAESISEKKQASLPRERSPAERRHSPSKQQREASFHSQMSHIQSDMSPSGRVFSKFIHNKAVEKTTNVLGATVARPNALFVSSIFAFVTITILYLVAKYYGYQIAIH
ncbi:MAG: hypothetical protein EOO17_02230 [Chloroflexi bacterium]|nr:MAG: hypothetical protein EOO17_02230 [Chloroflexota bacterium]